MTATSEAAETSMTAAFGVVTLDDISGHHRKERKELQAKIQELKKNAPKSDKKKRKEVLEEIARLESSLEQRHAQELLLVSGVQAQKQNKAIREQQLSNDSFEPVVTNHLKEQHQRVSKAQKRRDKKLREAKEREAEILACQEDSKNAPKAVELRAIISLLKERHLMLHYIPSDGDCLYNAVRHQLLQSGQGLDYSVRQLREETANYITSNKEALICYMTNQNTGDLLNDDEFGAYCESVRSTPAWGGQIELKALASILKVPIEVLQATGPPTIQCADEFAGPNLIITYHRHMYSLGEHYNGTKPLDRDAHNDEDTE